MKYLLIICLTVLIACSDDECHDARAAYERAQNQHAAKMKEAGKLSDQLDEFQKEDAEQLPEMLTVEDELNTVLIDIAFIEIEMEELKSNQFKCF
jgi:hypothetical protein